MNRPTAFRRVAPRPVGRTDGLTASGARRVAPHESSYRLGVVCPFNLLPCLSSAPLLTLARIFLPVSCCVCFPTLRMALTLSLSCLMPLILRISIPSGMVLPMPWSGGMVSLALSILAVIVVIPLVLGLPSGVLRSLVVSIGCPIGPSSGSNFRSCCMDFPIPLSLALALFALSVLFDVLDV